MNITISQEGAVSIVTVTGTIMHEDIATLRSRLSDSVSNSHARIVLDLKSVGYLSSKFLAVLIDIQSAAKKRGGDIMIANANTLITNLFDMTRLKEKIRLFDSVDTAREALVTPGDDKRSVD
ncbi:MAG: STAS domain-containing protein [Chitinispirillaceae bacterium]|nr:STAS domain-containing protein [Chitinispirillaceae bacterium]